MVERLRQIGVLQHGFRPFFLLGAVWAAVAVILWMGVYQGHVAVPTAFGPLVWHRHEMLFGFVAAVMAGFLLTAVPNWTGRPFLSGLPLAGLALLWMAGRAAAAFSDAIGLVPAMIVDGGFLIVLAAWAAREIRAAGNRNLPVAAIVALLGILNILDYVALLGPAGLAGPAGRLAIGLVIVLISLIGGRIVPAFTRNWLANQPGGDRPLPTLFNNFDKAVLGVTIAAFLLWGLFPNAGISGGVLILAGLLHLVRLARWRGWRTGAEILVLILHLAYLWVPVGLILLGGGILMPAVPGGAGVHALSAGAMGAMPLAVMTRASLGHTGRALHAGPGTVLIYALVIAGGITRVAAYFLPAMQISLLGFSAGLWAGAFGLFVLLYGPLLFSAAGTGGEAD